MSSKNLVNAFVLLGCSDETHENCLKVVDTLAEKVNNVTQAYTTYRKIDGKSYCVAARALVQSQELPKFKRKLENLSSHPPQQVSVDRVLIRRIRQ